MDGSGGALQEAITAAETWASSWHGQFGHSNTKLLSIGKASSYCGHMNFEIEQSAITKVKEHKHLGVYLTSDLRWTEHVEYITGNAKKTYWAPAMPDEGPSA